MSKMTNAEMIATLQRKLTGMDDRSAEVETQLNLLLNERERLARIAAGYRVVITNLAELEEYETPALALVASEPEPEPEPEAELDGADLAGVCAVEPETPHPTLGEEAPPAPPERLEAAATAADEEVVAPVTERPITIIEAAVRVLRASPEQPLTATEITAGVSALRGTLVAKTSVQAILSQNLDRYPELERLAAGRWPLALGKQRCGRGG